MKYKRLSIPDLILCKPDVHKDNRGYFLESFKLKSLNDFIGHEINFCQENESKSTYGVLRGLHYQIGPYSQTKLVKVIYGSVLDIAVDLRIGYPTFGQHVSVELNDLNKNQLLIPKGFAHGFVVKSDFAIFSYKVDNYYNLKSERGIIFNDKSLNIDWKINPKDLIVSSKDLDLLDFKNAEYFDFVN